MLRYGKDLSRDYLNSLKFSALTRNIFIHFYECDINAISGSDKYAIKSIKPGSFYLSIVTIRWGKTAVPVEPPEQSPKPFHYSVTVFFIYLFRFTVSFFFKLNRLIKLIQWNLNLHSSDNGRSKCFDPSLKI